MAGYYLVMTGVATVYIPAAFFPRPRRKENMVRSRKLEVNLQSYSRQAKKAIVFFEEKKFID